MAVAQLDQQQQLSLAQESERRSEFAQSWRRFRANRLAVIGMLFIILIILLAVFAPLIAPFDPTEIIAKRGAPSSAEHPLGFDDIGRDLLSRIIYGTPSCAHRGPRLHRGFAADWRAGWRGIGLLWRLGSIRSCPASWIRSWPSRCWPCCLLLASVLLGPSLTTTVVVIGITTWARFARVVRAGRAQP